MWCRKRLWPPFPIRLSENARRKRSLDYVRARCRSEEDFAIPGTYAQGCLTVHPPRGWELQQIPRSATGDASGGGVLQRAPCRCCSYPDRLGSPGEAIDTGFAFRVAASGCPFVATSPETTTTTLAAGSAPPLRVRRARWLCGGRTASRDLQPPARAAKATANREWKHSRVGHIRVPTIPPETRRRARRTATSPAAWSAPVTC